MVIEDLSNLARNKKKELSVLESIVIQNLMWHLERRYFYQVLLQMMEAI